jgi:hypothetical protein
MIDEFVQTRGIGLRHRRILPFPTRYDESVFFPLDPSSAKASLGLPPGRILVVAVGRVNGVKGWDLVLDAFRMFLHTHGDAAMCFVGDGEDRAALLHRAADLGLSDHVTVTGFLQPAAVAGYLNAADLVVFGSHHEGWSVAMLEALACGKAVVATDVSGARDMIVEGRNGFLVRQRDPERFAQAMEDALHLDAAPVSTATAGRYGLGGLAHELGQVWSPLKE